MTGGQRQGAIYEPTIVADVNPEMRISCEELFGPAVAVTPFSRHRRGDRAGQRQQLRPGRRHLHREPRLGDAKFAREVESGNLHINWGPQWRADLMPYGGLKDSGFGKEGPRYAVEEMTELKMVIFHLNH